MKPRDLQLGLRKNPDSPRVHGLRLAANSSLLSSGRLSRNSGERDPSPPAPLTSEDVNFVQEDATNETTGGEARWEGQLLTVQEVADLLRVPVSWIYGHTRTRSSEQIPGYRVGKYWRFNADEVMSWLREARRQSVLDRDA
jgi:excisionase family DNA binding protein